MSMSPVLPQRLAVASDAVRAAVNLLESTNANDHTPPVYYQASTLATLQTLIDNAATLQRAARRAKVRIKRATAVPA